MNDYYRPPAPQSAGTYLGPLLILALVVFGGSWLAGQWGVRRPLNDASATSRLVEARGELASDEKSTIALFKQAAPSVAYITTLVNSQPGYNMRSEEIPAGTGSGFVWDTEGHIVTNFHVLQRADAARVTLNNQSVYRARYVGGSPDDDLAVLKIDAPASDLPAIPLGSSKELAVGQKTFAIGNPFGLDHTLTTGIVSALGRSIQGVPGRSVEGLIQTDAAINPGNSGGPLLDSAGRLIGVNVAIRQGAQGIGFAIPVDTVNQVVPELIRRGRVTPVAPPALGVTLAEERLARRYGVRSGLLVLDVQQGLSAAEAGVRPMQRNEAGEAVLGDVIVAVDGQVVQTRADLQKAVTKKKAGDTLVLTVLRDGERLLLPVRLLPASG